MADMVLVTGVTGFVGGHVALDLLNKGYRVRGSVRNLARAHKVRAALTQAGADVTNLEFVELNLTSDDNWQSAMKNVRFLAHVASPFVTAMPKDKMELIGPAVAGTERALGAALSADVERIVLTSSAAAVMYGHGKSRTKPFSSADWTNLKSDEINAYVESKTLAEQRAWQIMDAAGRRADLVVINPTGIFGPLLDEDPGTSGELLLRLLKGGFPAAPRLGFGIVDVRDVAELHRLALETPEAGGHRFPVSAITLTVMEMAKVLAKGHPAYRSKLPRVQLPDWFVYFYALFSREIRDNLGELGIIKHINSAEAVALLGHPLIAADEALGTMVDSFERFGLV